MMWTALYICDLLVWGCFWWFGPGHLVAIEANLKATAYNYVSRCSTNFVAAVWGMPCPVFFYMTMSPCTKPSPWRKLQFGVEGLNWPEWEQISAANNEQSHTAVMFRCPHYCKWVSTCWLYNVYIDKAYAFSVKLKTLFSAINKMSYSLFPEKSMYFKHSRCSPVMLLLLFQ